MTNYYVDVSDELADRLSGVPSSEIEEALEEVAAAHEEDQKDSADELSQYSSLDELRKDSELSPADKKRMELRWQRVVGRRKRH
jgi:hypothetical protein